MSQPPEGLTGRVPARPLRLLVAEGEPPEDRERRRESVGNSSGETYEAVLERLAPGATVHRVAPADAGAAAEVPDAGGLEGYDAVFLTGSPLHLYRDTPEARRQVAFMRTVYESGTPAFGSCAGLQVATVAAGGTVRPNARGHEAAFARRLVRTGAGRGHPLLDGRPEAWDAPAIHSDEVEALPEGGVALAANGVTAVQAAEIRHGPRGGVFWGVQYHPELTLGEVAAALRRQADALAEEGPGGSREAVEAHADLIAALDAEPGRRDLAWRLGLDEQVTDPARRETELRNFVERLVLPTRAARGRG